MFLAYYLVRCAPHRGADLAELTRRVARVTQPIKSRKSYLDSMVNMKCMNAIWPHLNAAAKAHFMLRTLPMTAGVSNVLLREPWIERHRNCILGYSRAVPTGPNAPLVLAPTTFGENLNVGVTYRITGFSRAKIDELLERFLDLIQNPFRRRLPDYGGGRGTERASFVAGYGRSAGEPLMASGRA